MKPRFALRLSAVALAVALLPASAQPQSDDARRTIDSDVQGPPVP